MDSNKIEPDNNYNDFKKIFNTMQKDSLKRYFSN
jgi:hypothetical protein